MDFLLLIVVVIAAIFVRGVIMKALWGGGGSTGGRGIVIEKVSVKINIEKFSDLPPEAPDLWTALVNAHGVLNSPSIGYPRVSIGALDVTESSDPKPLFCEVEELCDGEGMFHYVKEIPTPHSSTQLNGSTIGVIPLSLLKFPRRGRRKLRVFIRIIGERVISLEEDIYFNNPIDGYLDQADHMKECEVVIAKLAFSASAVDGEVDKTETAIITNFFSDRLTGAFEEEERKQQVTQALQECAQVIPSKTHSDMFRDIQDFCNELVSFDNEGISEVAFELCLRVIVADRKIEAAERRVVELLRSDLNITTTYAKSLEDRLLSVALYVEDDCESKLGLPSGLSSEQKKSWYAKEYGKWKNRVTHSDPEKAREAEVRLNLIAQCRSELE